MVRKTLPVFGLVVVLSLFAVPAFMPVAALSFAAPMIPATSGLLPHSLGALDSTNWGGYAINETANSVKAVQGSWTQPATKCTSTTQLQAAAFWVGIDGLTSKTVEQTGTLVECVGGVAYYFAWYEFYPAALTQITTITVTPGDKFTASVTYSSSTKLFTTKLTDTTTGKSYSKSSAVSGALRSSAEWIVEAPSTVSGIVQLPNFGTASFTKGTATTTVKGNIGSFGAAVDSINIVKESNHSKLMASTSSLTSGSNFKVTWKSSGP